MGLLYPAAITNDPGIPFVVPADVTPSVIATGNAHGGIMHWPLPHPITNVATMELMCLSRNGTARRGYMVLEPKLCNRRSRHILSSRASAASRRYAPGGI